ncbi:Palmitoyltransferase [Rhodotorula toruloides]
MGGKFVGRLWITGVLSLISFIGFSSQIWVVLPSYGWDWTDRELWWRLGPFNVLLGLVFLNYGLTARTNPGTVPKGWEPDWRLLEAGQVEVKKRTGGPRFCRTCRVYKPPRAHHCRQCGHCILRMDHHCPWVNNCVGHHNYAHFLRFLFFVDVACSYHLWMISTRAFQSLAFGGNPTTTQVVLLILNYTACLPVLIAVGIFSLFQFWSLLTNTTTIESWEKDRAASLKRRGKIREYKYPYHLTYLQNIHSVLGKNSLFWCWPQPTPGDGLAYPVAPGADVKDQLAWPPRDEFQPYSRKRARPLPPPEEAFTYGDDLNPALLRDGRAEELLPGQAGLDEAEDALEGGLRRRQFSTGAARRPPWQDQEDDSDGTSVYDETSSEEDEDDEVPLGTLAARRARTAAASGGGVAGEDELAADNEEEEDLDPERVVRIRRGSEGYEVRPRLAGPPFHDRLSASRCGTTTDDGGWERIDQEGGLSINGPLRATTEDSLRCRPSHVVYDEGA